MRIFIQGAGAVGALLGFHLAAAGHVVTLGLRNKPAGNLPDTWPKREGSPILRLIGSNPDSDQAVPVRLTGPAEPPPADLILLTTKAADAKTAAEAAAPALAQGGAAVFLSNGLGMEEAVFGCFPQGTGNPRSRLWRRASRVARKRPLHGRGKNRTGRMGTGGNGRPSGKRTARYCGGGFLGNRDIDGGCHRPETFRLGKIHG